MAEFDRPSVAARPGTAAVVDQGLRSYMLRVYNYMGIGLVVTGLVAYFAYTAAFVEQGGHIVGLTGFGEAIFGSPLQWVVMLAPLAFVLVLSFGINKLSVPRDAAAVLGLRGRDGPVPELDLRRLHRRPRSPRCSSSRRRRSAP